MKCIEQGWQLFVAQGLNGIFLDIVISLDITSAYGTLITHDEEV